MMKSEYHILWIDDEWEKMISFKTNCKLNYGLILHPFKTWKEGLDEYALHRDFYEAAILDAKGLDDSVNEVTETKGLRKAIKRIYTTYPDLPYFIFTGQPDLYSNETFNDWFEKYYKKAIDDDKLCEDIINAIKDKPDRLIKNKYSDVLRRLEPSLYEDVLDIIKYHENGEIANADIFNKTRKVLDWMMKYLSDYGLLAKPFDGTNLNECSLFLCNRGLTKLVPIYAQRHIHSLVEITNEGSHRLSSDEAVKTGAAPYLISATVFELLDLLVWLHQLPKDDESKRKVDSIVAKTARDLAEKQKKNGYKLDNKDITL